ITNGYPFSRAISVFRKNGGGSEYFFCPTILRNLLLLCILLTPIGNLNTGHHRSSMHKPDNHSYGARA
ncbi:hypothetical protein, partial [Alteromonas mediterranea]|uniref:hypothetical protein n=1 Tax=Alteromonas mediterranea TaxID=314275 RepID=UPI00241F472F